MPREICQHFLNNPVVLFQQTVRLNPGFRPFRIDSFTAGKACHKKHCHKHEAGKTFHRYTSIHYSRRLFTE